MAGRIGYERKIVTLQSEDSVSINRSDIGIIMIFGTGSTMTGSAILAVGYGVAETSINIISSVASIVSIGTGSGLVVTKQQWGGSLITNKDTKTHEFALITMR